MLWVACLTIYFSNCFAVQGIRALNMNLCWIWSVLAVLCFNWLICMRLLTQRSLTASCQQWGGPSFHSSLVTLHSRKQNLSKKFHCTALRTAVNDRLPSRTDLFTRQKAQLFLCSDLKSNLNIVAGESIYQRDGRQPTLWTRSTTSQNILADQHEGLLNHA